MELFIRRRQKEVKKKEFEALNQFLKEVDAAVNPGEFLWWASLSYIPKFLHPQAKAAIKAVDAFSDAVEALRTKLDAIERKQKNDSTPAS